MTETQAVSSIQLSSLPYVLRPFEAIIRFGRSKGNSALLYFLAILLFASRQRIVYLFDTATDNPSFTFCNPKGSVGWFFKLEIAFSESKVSDAVSVVSAK